MSEPRSAPTVLQLVLARRLQKLRKAAGMTAQDVGRRLRLAHTTVTRIERAEVALKYVTVSALLEVYGVDGAEKQDFLDLSEKANISGWWQDYRDVLPDIFSLYVSLEASAAQIRTYEPHFVPGLLQTEDYARSVLRLGFPRVEREELDRRTALRLERQLVLTRQDAPRLWVVMDETVLRRPVGGPEVMRAQIDRLMEACDLPNVALQIAEFRGGAHPGAYGPFALFRFDGIDFPDVLYCESLTRSAYIEGPDEISVYREVLDQMIVRATSPRKTRAVLSAIREET
ncbi:helix-turn-helix domain-containing protein [Streptomyces sp. NPDC004609]|uniref:helix-turn-helix domain-containing protein n=1 Tax=Streptomyces sp. NPDC004609 TaxID=3364704 RepID=UPI0036A63B87